MLIVLGGLWLCLWRSAGRLLGLPAIAAGCAGYFFVQPPDLLVSGDGELFAVNRGGGVVYLTPGNGRRFERDQWLRRLAARGAAPWPAAPGIFCDGTGCVFEKSGRTISIVMHPDTAVEDCARADYLVVLTRWPERAMCDDRRVVLNTFRLWRDGAHSVRFTMDGAVLETSRERRGDRPWSRLSEKRRQYLRTSPTSRP